MEINFKMNDEEMVTLYCYLSSIYMELDNPMKDLLYRIEKELFSNLTISQIETIQNSLPEKSH